MTELPISLLDKRGRVAYVSELLVTCARSDAKESAGTSVKAPPPPLITTPINSHIHQFSSDKKMDPEMARLQVLSDPEMMARLREVNFSQSLFFCRFIPRQLTNVR